jgi:transcriptional regulator with XRE-family HTH domain
VTRATFTEKAERFRKLLVAAREESGLTQVQVAGKLRKPQSYVSKIERGERRLDIIEFFELAEILKIDPFEFLQTLQRKH